MTTQTPSTTLPDSNSGGVAGNLANWMQVYSGLFGGPSQTQTQTSNVSADQAAAILQRALGSGGALANTMAQQRMAGMGRSSGNMFATNDLMSKLAADVAMKQAGTTTTTKNNGLVSGSPSGLGGALAGAGGIYSLYQFMNGAGKAKKPGELTPWETLSKGISDLTGSSGNSGSSSSGSASSGSSSNSFASVGNFLSSLFGGSGTATASSAGSTGSLGPADMLAMAAGDPNSGTGPADLLMAADAGKANATNEGARVSASGDMSSLGPADALSLLNTMNDVTMKYDEKHQASGVLAMAGLMLGGPQGAAIGNELGKGWAGQQLDQGIYQTGQNFRGINNWDNVAKDEVGKFNNSWLGTEINNGLQGAGAALDSAANAISNAGSSFGDPFSGLNNAGSEVESFIKSLNPF